MGTYINKGNGAFRDIVTHEYIDKSALIAHINSTLNSERRYSCVTRCRRFGKSMAAKMLCAYYDKSCDSRELFAGLAIEQDASFDKYLNKYTVLYLDVTSFTARPELGDMIIREIQRKISEEVMDVFPDVKYKDNYDLMDVLSSVHNATGEKFIFIIDEWDAICREYPARRKFKGDTSSVPPTILDQYVMLLRRLFKTQDSDEVFAGAYLTGILPIKKYNTESALNNFREYSMIMPGRIANHLGFTRKEVVALCQKYDMNSSEMERWYDGYRIGKETHIYNPYSVMRAIEDDMFQSYWASTGAYDSVKTYIQMNYDGLKDDVIKMLSGEHVYVNTTSFQNDMHIINSKNDVFTALIHLGYLAYDRETGKCYIPNKEVADEMSNAVKTTSWTRLAKALEDSQNLLDATIAGNEQAVARGIEQAHDENTSILAYNDENSLACVLSIAYICAKNDYIIHREYATGKGYADLVMIPRRNVDKPALVIELKYDHPVETAIDQIKRKDYPAKVAEYSGAILLVGITYNNKTKTHTCKIEQFNA